MRVIALLLFGALYMWAGMNSIAVSGVIVPDSRIALIEELCGEIDEETEFDARDECEQIVLNRVTNVSDGLRNIKSIKEEIKTRKESVSRQKQFDEKQERINKAVQFIKSIPR